MHDGDGRVGALRIAGPIRTAHDALYAYPTAMETNGTRVSEAATAAGVPRVTLADAATQRVKWVWQIPVGWDKATVRFGTINEGPGTGDVVWQFDYKQIRLGEATPNGAVTTVPVGALTAGSVGRWEYNTPSALVGIATPSGFFSDKPLLLCSLARLGSDGSDTLTNGISVAVATLTRVD